MWGEGSEEEAFSRSEKLRSHSLRECARIAGKIRIHPGREGELFGGCGVREEKEKRFHGVKSYVGVLRIVTGSGGTYSGRNTFTENFGDFTVSKTIGFLLSLPVFTFCFLPFATSQDSGAIVVEGKPVQTSELPAALIDGNGPDWREMVEADFVNANCNEDTWSWKDGLLSCTGRPVGVLRSAVQYTNFELVVQWRHLKEAGNSGVFVWTPESSLNGLKPGSLPEGIECQVLDHGYTTQYEKSSGNKADWFTTNGDVFPVGASKLNPFPPLSPDGVRSFPSANHTKGVGEWNHYYIRAINGEVRLWVNGHEVSGGSGAEPATGFIALESEGSPIEFRNIRIRILP